jgi:hypothetical protein
MNQYLLDRIETLSRMFQAKYTSYFFHDNQDQNPYLPYLLKVLTDKKVFLYNKFSSDRTRFYQAYIYLKQAYLEPGLLEEVLDILDQDEFSKEDKISVYSVISVFIKDFSDVYLKNFDMVIDKLKAHVKKAIAIRDNIPIYSVSTRENSEDKDLYESYTYLQSIKRRLPKSSVPLSKYQVNFAKIAEDAKNSDDEKFKEVASEMLEIQRDDLKHTKAPQLIRIISLLNRISLGSFKQIDMYEDDPNIQKMAIFILNLHGILLPEDTIIRGIIHQNVLMDDTEYKSEMLELNLTLVNILSRLLDKRNAGKLSNVLPDDIIYAIREMI